MGMTDRWRKQWNDKINSGTATYEDTQLSQNFINSKKIADSPFYKEMAAAGITMPSFSSVLDNQGNLPDYLKVQDNYDSSYFDEMKAYAEGEEPSPWLQAQQQEIASQGQKSLGSLGAQQASGIEEGQQTLSMRRGLTGGASSRIQEQAAEDAMFKGQNIRSGMGMQNLAASTQEEADKAQTRKMLPGLSLQKAAYETGVSGTNISNMLAEKQREREASMDLYNTQMSSWATGQLGQAMAQLA